MKQNNILITGATGNIGSRLIQNFEPWVSKHILLLARSEGQPISVPTGINYEFAYGDLLKDNIEKYLPGITHVIHLAALTDTGESHKKPKLYKKANLDLVRRIADACLKRGIKFFFPSTTSIYACGNKIVDETCAKLRAYSPYAKAKLEAEKYLLQLKKRGLKFVICRFGTVFGYSDGIRFNTAVNKFVYQAMNNEPLSVWKNVWQQKRPYLHVQDCVRAINFILKNDLFEGEIYNVLSGNYTVEDVVKTLRRFYPKLTIGFVTPPPINKTSYGVSDVKIRKLGFKPIGTIQSGIKETINQLKQNKSTPR